MSASSRRRARATPSTPSSAAGAAAAASRPASRRASSGVVRAALASASGSAGAPPTFSRSARSSRRRWAAVAAGVATDARRGASRFCDGTAAFRGGGANVRCTLLPPGDAVDAHDDADRRDAQDAADRFDGDGRATSTVDAPLATDDAAGADAGRRAGPQGTTRRQDDEPREKVRSDPSLMEQVSFRRPVFVFARSATVSMV